ncbi:hypothetical protein ASPZODRAFT_65750 [Penicilliopsis zonata CBS 506.65]|uniref:Uncharacterized protein n=1 Tax=Penicilliopsis zonata CBS 506.65 TaxID=1073090 RepID=A0A1L9SJC2_9EURO|nr:hypothetical protein ASPZODRAFT_65750 [Penicilliopsis zonata CBS 506.65]OJJ47298.1 hypothetical protein ASPZODRAFT_65750 [Penicilliopsis zonata CBS 506.65]
MEEIAGKIQILPPDLLREISKGSLVRYVNECNDARKVSQLWQSLLMTFSTASLSNDHTTAACNAVSAFLDAASASENEETQQLAFSGQTWLAVFQVYLDRFEYTKPKPMRQVLISLVTILAKNQDSQEKNALRSRIGDAVLPGVILSEQRSRLKGSLVSLDVFIRKTAVTVSDLVDMTATWLLNNYERFLALCVDDCKALSITPAQFAQADMQNQEYVASLREIAAKVFVLSLLKQVQNKELASVSGSVLATFVERMKYELESQQVSPEESQQWSAIWAAPFKHISLRNLDNLETIANNVFEPLFTADPSGFKVFINQLPVKSLLAGDMTDAPLAEYMVLFAALQVGKKLGLVHEDHYFTNSASKKTADEVVVLNSEIIGQFLLHRESSIRIATLALLITTFSTTKPVSAAAMRVIMKGLPSMHAESDAYSRGEVVSLTRKLIVRLKSGVTDDQKSTLATTTDSTQQAKTDSNSLYFQRSDTATRAYLGAYIDFLKADLQSTASYQRHITALKALGLVLESGLDTRVVRTQSAKPDPAQVKWKLHMEVVDSSLLRLLVDLLLDPFEEVRATSLNIIKLFPRDILLTGLASSAESKPNVGVHLIDALSRAEQLASNTSRADHADTVARLYHLLFSVAATGQATATSRQWWETKIGIVDAILKKLEEKLSLPGGLFSSAMRNAPLHGYVSALRYIILTPKFYQLISDEPGKDFGPWRTIHTRISKICDQIWLEVRPVLCIDSPEGHTDEPAEDMDVGPKDILSYSWRALRESSLLLHSTLANTTYGPRGDDGLKRADYEKIGTASFIQLAELRHRGAFTTVSQTFATCCQRCSQSNDPSISSLPQGWYQEAKKIIFETASKLTRRSAGIPALVTGVLSSTLRGPLFQQVITELLEITGLLAEQSETTQDMELPQVHAMNCLKDIFTNNKLGPRTEAYVMPALTLSAERMGSPIWNLRNSGLMLFRALLTRMYRDIPGARLGFGGESGSEPGARVSFHKYPGLMQLVSDLLAPEGLNKVIEAGSIDMVTERVFPALELVGEKIPMLSDNDDTTLRDLVLHWINSPVWGIREHAARVYASLLNRSDILQELQKLIDFESQQTSQNLLHGKAMCIRYALRRFQYTPQPYWNGHIDEIVSLLRRAFSLLFPSSRSPFVASALMETLNDTVEQSVRNGQEGRMATFLEEVFENHDLYDILDYLLNTNEPSWKSSSTTRASSLLRRTLAWAAVLKMMLRGRESDLTLFLQALSSFDPNAARWILEELDGLFGEKEAYRVNLLNIYTSILLGDHLEIVRTSATANLASILERLLDYRHDNLKGINLPWDALSERFRSAEETENWNREMSDAGLRLQGCLLAVKASLSQWQALPDFGSALRSWTTKLRFALQEETEFTTRLAAVKSLGTFGRILRPLGSPARTDPVFLDVYLILYDMLNDDDEELRDISAATASWALSYSSVSPSKAVALAPLNASGLLAEFIARSYSDSPLLSQRIFNYACGQGPRISDCSGAPKLVPVSDLFSELRKESTVLFVEEKQNLFIDDVRELGLWSQKLSILTESSYQEGLVKSLSQWVSDGLGYIADLSTEETGKDGLLGWASKPETFTLGLRVFSLATAFTSDSFAGRQYLGQDREVLRRRLQTLQETGQAAYLHHEWLSMIQKALE